jgi:hypothetical protein
MPGEEARRSHAGPLIASVLGWVWIAHDFELLADAERGLLLRSSALLDGQEVARAEVAEVAFDEDLPEHSTPYPRTGTDWSPPEATHETVYRLWRLEPTE